MTKILQSSVIKKKYNKKYTKNQNKQKTKRISIKM